MAKLAWAAGVALVVGASLTSAVVGSREHARLFALVEEQGRSLRDLEASNDRLARLLGDGQARTLTTTLLAARAAPPAATSAAATAPPAEEAPPPEPTADNLQSYERARKILGKALAGGEWTQEDADEFRAAAHDSGMRARELLTEFGMALGGGRIRGNFRP
jgi:hypothetical protein